LECACVNACACTNLLSSRSQYYPPDFDPAKLPRGQRGNKDAQMKVGSTVRISMRCRKLAYGVHRMSHASISFHLRVWLQVSVSTAESCMLDCSGPHDAGHERAVQHVRQLHVQGHQIHHAHGGAHFLGKTLNLDI
jgi:hypothetical protein